MNVADELQKLEDLRRSGTIDESEFARAKSRLLGDTPAVPPVYVADSRDEQTRQWATVLHLSQFAGYVAPLAGMVVPIILWQVKKADLPGLDPHGKVVANWIISGLIYAVLCVVLIIVIIGIPLLMVLGVLGIVFPIIGAIKAGNGEVWRYPLSINFFK